MQSKTGKENGTLFSGFSGDLQNKKRSSPKLKRFFCPNSGDLLTEKKGLRCFISMGPIKPIGPSHGPLQACFCTAGFQIVSLLTLQGHRNPTIRLSAKTAEDILSKFIQNNSKIQYCQFKRSNAIPTSAYKFRHTKLANRFKSPENLS